MSRQPQHHLSASQPRPPQRQDEQSLQPSLAPQQLEQAIRQPTRATLTSATIQALQRSHGNRFVQRLLQQSHSQPTIQRAFANRGAIAAPGGVNLTRAADSTLAAKYEAIRNHVIYGGTSGQALIYNYTKQNGTAVYAIPLVTNENDANVPANATWALFTLQGAFDSFIDQNQNAVALPVAPPPPPEISTEEIEEIPGQKLLCTVNGVRTFTESHQGKHTTTGWPGFKGSGGTIKTYFASDKLAWNNTTLLSTIWQLAPRSGQRGGTANTAGYVYHDEGENIDSNDSISTVIIQWTWHAGAQAYFIHGYPGEPEDGWEEV